MKIRSLAIACSTLEPSRFPKSPWGEVAVSGRSNVGKSSLLNVLFGRKSFARISKEPGKTRTINFYAVNDRFYLVDLPGYGYAKVAQELRAGWTRVVEEYVDKRPSLAGVVQLIDARHPPSKDDCAVIARLVAARRQFLVVFTKSDKASKSERPRAVRDFEECVQGMRLTLLSPRPGPAGEVREGAESGPPESPGGEQKPVVKARPEQEALAVPALFFSSRTGEGKDELWGWISSLLGIKDAR